MHGAWFSPVMFGALYGAIGGSLCGIAGGVIGTLIGVFAPRGKHKALVMGCLWAMVSVGGASLVFGVAALVAGQPYAIWYPPLLLGLIVGIVSVAVMPAARQAYRRAEERRVAAQSIREGQ